MVTRQEVEQGIACAFLEHRLLLAVREEPHERGLVLVEHGGLSLLGRHLQLLKHCQESREQHALNQSQWRVAQQLERHRKDANVALRHITVLQNAKQVFDHLLIELVVIPLLLLAIDDRQSRHWCR